jgi:hypothetical protein
MTKSCMFLVLSMILVPLFATNDYVVQTYRGPDGRMIDKVIVPGIPVDKRVPGSIAIPTRSTVMLAGVPAFDWSYGCSATSAAMMAGYYDRHDHGHTYMGPTNGGLMPLTNSTWGSGECPLSATHQGYDGLATAGHVDRFWTNNSGSDPWGTSDPTGTYNGCTADYMGTNQEWWGNIDGSTTFYNYVDGSPLFDPADGTTGPPYGRDGIHGLRLFFESRGYSVSTNYNQYINGWDGNRIGYTYDDFKASINAGIPVMIQIEGHSMVGVGYESTSSTIYVHNTWDYNVHTMTWGGIYSGMAHYGVSVIQLNPPPIISLNSYNLHSNLQVGEEATDTFIIYNDGTGPLTYSLEQQEVLPTLNRGQITYATKEKDRSISGSTLTLDVSEYTPGNTMDLNLSVYNGSTDDEWLKQVYVTFPAGVTVNSTTNFVGGGGGDMIPSPTSGNGITIHWTIEGEGWGVVYMGQTAVATANVTIDPSFVGALTLPYEIHGDIYGAEPHIVTASIALSQSVPPISWFHPLPLSGTILPEQSQTITGYFSALGMTPGTYEAIITLHSNDPYDPSIIVNVSMNVSAANNIPTIQSIVKTQSGVKLYWYQILNVNQYKVYRSFNPNGGFTLLGTTNQAEYEDIGANGKAFYRVTAEF